ncbi:hypothetical protein [Streptomyces sp. NPDC001880]
MQQRLVALAMRLGRARRNRRPGHCSNRPTRPPRKSSPNCAKWPGASTRRRSTTWDSKRLSAEWPSAAASPCT